MNTRDALERQLPSVLRESLDREWGPDRTWPESPAARRVAELERQRRRPWPLRLLAVAAVITVAGGVALVGGLPDLPPDGPRSAANGWIAFTVHQEETADVRRDTDIWFVGFDQKPRRVIGSDTDGVDQLCPAFAPDGRSLAYGQVEGSDTDGPAENRNAVLVVADVSVGGLVSDRLTIDVGDGLPPPCPVWSPDGDRLAFGVPRTSPINPETSAAGSEVWIATLEDRGITVLPDLLATDLEWSPDGELVAIASGADDRADGNRLRDGRIHLYAPSSGAMRSLETTLGASLLTWSPDGRRIAYETGDSGHELRVIDVQSGEDEVLAARYRALHGIGPVWSPDGEKIVYQRAISSERHEVVVVTPGDRSEETGHAREVVIGPDDTGRGLFPWRVTWSPDSEYLLYLAWSYSNDCCDEETVEHRSLVAVPTDLDAPSVLLTGLDSIVVEDGYDDTTFVPIQIWGRAPSD